MFISFPTILPTPTILIVSSIAWIIGMLFGFLWISLAKQVCVSSKASIPGVIAVLCALVILCVGTFYSDAVMKEEKALLEAGPVQIEILQRNAEGVIAEETYIFEGKTYTRETSIALNLPELYRVGQTFSSLNEVYELTTEYLNSLPTEQKTAISGN